MWSVVTPILNYLTNFFVQIMIIQILFTLVLKKSKVYFPVLCLWVALSILSTVFGNIYSSASIFMVFGWLNLAFPLALAVNIVLFKLATASPIRHIIFYGSASYAIQHFVHMISLVFIDFFKLNFRQEWGLVAYFIVCLLAFSAFFFLIINRRVRKSNLTTIDNKSLLILSVITIFMTYLLANYLLPSSVGNNPARIYAGICCLFLLFMQFSIFDKTKLQQENIMTQQLLIAEQKQLELWRTNVDIINTKCHDLKNQISSIRQISDKDKQNASLAEIEKAILIYDNISKTGNETLDIVLTEKKLYCESNNIAISIIADAKNLGFMRDMDICSLFGNLLDNAIEATLEVSDKEKHIISLNVYNKGQLVCVHIDNYYEGKIQLHNGSPITTKSDKQYHGFGIKSIQMIIDNYGGEYNISLDDDMFNIDIILPISA